MLKKLTGFLPCFPILMLGLTCLSSVDLDILYFFARSRYDDPKVFLSTIASFNALSLHGLVGRGFAFLGIIVVVCISNYYKLLINYLFLEEKNCKFSKPN